MWVARIENYLTVWTSLEIIHFLYRDAAWEKNIEKKKSLKSITWNGQTANEN